MAETAAAPAKKATKAKKTATKKVASHPSYNEMVVAAIGSLKDRKGSSGQAIKKYITANYKVDDKSVGPHVRLALKRGVTSGALKQVKGTGASGSFKLPDKVTKPKKAVTKKAKSPKKVKKTSDKPATKKKTPKKSVKKAAKSPASKKPKAKKAKKPTPKKAAAKK